jgi:hypothetical protein
MTDHELEIDESIEANDQAEWSFQVRGDGPTTTVVFTGPDDDVQMRIDVLRAAGRAQRDFPVPHWLVLRALDAIREAQAWPGHRGPEAHA